MKAILRLEYEVHGKVLVAEHELNLALLDALEFPEPIIGLEVTTAVKEFREEIIKRKHQPPLPDAPQPPHSQPS